MHDSYTKTFRGFIFPVGDCWEDCWLWLRLLVGRIEAVMLESWNSELGL